MKSGLFERWYGPKPENDSPDLSLWNYRTMLWAASLAFPVQVASILLVLTGTSGARLEQLGLTTHRLGDNVVFGYLGWAVASVPVYSVNLLISVLQSSYFHVEPEHHPLTQLWAQHPDHLELALMVLTALVFAPVLEELLFRGMIQPWAGKRWWGGLPLMGVACLIALVQRQDKGLGLAITMFFLAMTPGFFIARLLGSFLSVLRARGANAAGAIYASSLLFAAGHSIAWPQPVSLFLLALFLGYLRYRTQSLVGPIVLHALFNSVACVYLLAS